MGPVFTGGAVHLTTTDILGSLSTWEAPICKYIIYKNNKQCVYRIQILYLPSWALPLVFHIHNKYQSMLLTLGCVQLLSW